MGTPETSREPCPDRILDDVGSAFGMGTVGGSAFHFLKGLYNSPNGERLRGGAQAVRMNAPRIGGSFAVWGGLFSAFDCTAVYIRQKEDPWNSIAAGAATGAFLQMRQGLGSASRSALFGGVLLALIEGAGIMMNRVLSSSATLPPGLEEVPPGLPSNVVDAINNDTTRKVENPPAAPSWFSGFFSGGKSKKEESNLVGPDAKKSEILEGFDTLPIPTFEYK